MGIGLRIPTRAVAGWAAEVIQQCEASIDRRRQHGAVMRNLFLTSDSRGSMATYPLIFDHVMQHAANLFSPSELNWHVAPYPYMGGGPRDKAMGRSAALHLTRHFREREIDSMIEEAVIWSLVKGKVFLQMLWASGGLEAHLVQPEVFGVLRDDLNSLEDQDAFFHSIWMTPDQFRTMVEYAGYPDARNIIKRAVSKPTGTADEPGPQPKVLRNIIIGAAYGAPYQPQGSPSPSTGRNLVDWLSAPEPTFNARVLASLVRVDELWVRDHDRGDWTTIQLAAKDILLTQEGQPRNLFADTFGNPNSKSNPLKGKQPFIEFCPNKVDGWFWGASECAKVALLQDEISKRIGGIANILRHEEDPSTYFSGGASINQSKWTALKRPGAFFTDAAPGAQFKQIGPTVSPGMWESLHEYEAMFERLGMTDIMRGRGTEGVRAQGHAETLVRTGSARLRRPAFAVKRAAEHCGAIGFDLLRAQDKETLIFEVPAAALGPFKGQELDPNVFEASVPGHAGVEFLMSLMGDRFKVSIPGLSASPAFATEQLATDFALAKAGVEGPEDLARRSGTPDPEELIAGLEERQAAQQALVAQHPELLKVLDGGRRKR